MSFATTSAPSAANRRAMPPPMPAAAPVITAILSSSSPMAADPTCRGSSDRRRTRRARECVAFEPSTGGSKLVTRTESSAQGGLARWAPRVTPPIGVELTPEQALACAFRILAGHRLQREHRRAHHLRRRRATVRCSSTRGACGGRRSQASDLCRVDSDGVQCRRTLGRHARDPHPHRAAPPARPTPASSSTTIRTTRRCSPRSARSRRCAPDRRAMFDGDLCFVDEYDGEVDDAE